MLLLLVSVLLVVSFPVRFLDCSWSAVGFEDGIASIGLVVVVVASVVVVVVVVAVVVVLSLDVSSREFSFRF